MTKWHLCVAFSKIYKDEVALASLREGGGPPQVVVGAREHRKETFSPKLVALSPAGSPFVGGNVPKSRRKAGISSIP
jgi:hypothetical protein